MRDGLYKVHFKTPMGEGGGVVYTAGGKLWGGDAGLYYVGSYTEAGDKLTASVNTNRHTQWPGLASVFGVDRVTIALNGTVSGDTVTCTGTAAQAPGVQFGCVLTRISD